MAEEPSPLVSMRTYLAWSAMAAGASFAEAQEAVSSTAIEHPEWELDKVQTMEQWIEEDQSNAD